MATTVIRLARDEDYSAIVALSDMPGGRDYLLTKFYDYMRDPHRVFLVVEIDSKIVSLFLTKNCFVYRILLVF